MAEQLMYPPTVWSYNHIDQDGHALPGHGHVCREVPNSLYLDAVAHRSVGDVVRAWASAPGTGYTDMRITRIDETGVYGELVCSTVRELQAWEVV